MEELFNDQILGYLNKLDWMFILTFITFVYIFRGDKTLTSWWKGHPSSYLTRFRNLLLSVPKKVRVMVLGVVYGLLYYYFMDLNKSNVHTLFASFLFSVAFHALVISHVESFFKKKDEAK